MKTSAHNNESSTPKGDALLTADQNAQMFNGLSPLYDRLNRILSLGLDHFWRRRAIALLDPVKGGHYLDIGCGTGDLSMELIRQQPSATIVGIDPAEEMLRLAKIKFESKGCFQKIEFASEDACAITFSDNSFDGVISAFCIRNISDRSSAFAEMVRVTKPGGYVMALELTRPRNLILRLTHWMHSRWLVPLAGRLVSQGSAYRYLNDSVEKFPPSEVISEEMSRAGIDSVTTHPLTGGTVTVFLGRVKQDQDQLVFATAPYLNAQPLTWGMRNNAELTLESAPPSALAEKLKDGTADAALVPVVDCIFDPGLAILDGLCVAADGAVISVLLCSDLPLQDIKRVAGDPNSHTSNLLTALLLHLYGSKAVVLPANEHGENADARVVIGDRALTLNATNTYDLAELWKQQTGLPFVFAVWACQQHNPHLKEMKRHVMDSYSVGSKAKSEIAKQFAAQLNLSEAACLDYIENKIHYTLGTQEREAIARFKDLLDEAGLHP